MCAVSGCAVAVLLLLMIGTVAGAPQQQLLFSSSRQSGTVPVSSDRDSAPARASSGRLIFTPERLVFSASRRSGLTPSRSPPIPPPSPSPPPPSPPPSVPPPAEGGMAHIQAYIQRARLSQAAGRFRQAQRALAASQATDRDRPRPRVGPRTPGAVAGSATAPRVGAGRSAATHDPLADFRPADDIGRLDVEELDSIDNLLDSAARAGLRSPGLALDDPEGPTDTDRRWPAEQVLQEPTEEEEEEAEDTIYGGGMRPEDLFYHGPLRSDDSPRGIGGTQSSQSITTSAQLLEHPAPVSERPRYLGDLVRLGRDFVYLPGLSPLIGRPAGREQTASLTAESSDSRQSNLPRHKESANVMYVYIVRGDGQSLDLYATNDRSGIVRAGEDDFERSVRRGAVVLEDSRRRGRNSRGQTDKVHIDQNEIVVTTKDLDSAADSSANLLTVVDESEKRDAAAAEAGTFEAEDSGSLEATSNDTNTTSTEHQKGKNLTASVYFDPINELVTIPEAEAEISVEGKSARTNIDQHDEEASSLELVPEDRGIFFFPGNVIHSFGITPSATGSPVVVSQPRPGIPSRLSSVNQSTPIAQLLTPPAQGLQALAAATPPAIDRQDTAVPLPPPPAPTAAVVSAFGTGRPTTGRPVIFTEIPADQGELGVSPTDPITSSKFVFPGGSSQNTAGFFQSAVSSSQNTLSSFQSAAGSSQSTTDFFQNTVNTGTSFEFPSPVSGSGRPSSATSRPFLFSSSRPRPAVVAAVAAERVDQPVSLEDGHCRPEPDCAVLSRRRRGCSDDANCPRPQRCCFSQCLGVSVCQEGTFVDRVVGLSALADVVVP